MPSGSSSSAARCGLVVERFYDGWFGLVDSRAHYPHGYATSAAEREAMRRLAVALLMLLSGCSELGITSGGDGKVEIQTSSADLCWSGAFGDRTVEGCGPSTVTLESTSGIFVANAQKQSEQGTLTLILMWTAAR